MILSTEEIHYIQLPKFRHDLVIEPDTSILPTFWYMNDCDASNFNVSSIPRNTIRKICISKYDIFVPSNYINFNGSLTEYTVYVRFPQAISRPEQGRMYTGFIIHGAHIKTIKAEKNLNDGLYYMVKITLCDHMIDLIERGWFFR